jgi:ankyrin repeat protein
MQALSQKHPDIALFLLDRGIDVNAKSDNGRTALWWACQMGYEDVARQLLDRGAGIRAKNQEGHTPLFAAAMGAHPQIVRLLLERGADAGATDKNGISVVTWARGQEVKDLLTRSKAVNVVKETEDKQKLLLDACGKRSSDKSHFEVSGLRREAVERLLEENVDPDTRDEAGKSALWWASRYGHLEVVELLLDHGAAVDGGAGETYHGTPLMAASGHGHLQVVDRLLAKGAHADRPNVNGWTPLIAACKEGFSEVVKALLNKRADANARTKEGETALMFASTEGNPEVVQLLLQTDVDVNAVDDKFKATPLMRAGSLGHLQVAEILLANGAGVNLRNIDNKTALSFAKEKNHEDVAELLLKYGAVE